MICSYKKNVYQCACAIKDDEIFLVKKFDVISLIAKNYLVVLELMLLEKIGSVITSLIVQIKPQLFSIN